MLLTVSSEAAAFGAGCGDMGLPLEPSVTAGCVLLTWCFAPCLKMPWGLFLGSPTDLVATFLGRSIPDHTDL